jgi:hypothetical protein
MRFESSYGNKKAGLKGQLYYVETINLIMKFLLN